MITLPAQIDGVTSRKDKTLKITLVTQELKEAGKLFDLQNELVNVGISPKGLNDDEIELLRESKFGIEDVPNEKSASQRLRSVLYIAFTQDAKGFDTFANYYANRMESIINFYKDKLE